MGARYPYYLLADSAEGQLKQAEVTRTAPSSRSARGDIRHGFVYRRAAYITSGVIANNAEIDVIWETTLGVMDSTREELNATLKTRWEEWEIPSQADASWPESAKKLYERW
jgi:adenine-specific DNA-methyltransferase